MQGLVQPNQGRNPAASRDDRVQGLSSQATEAGARRNDRPREGIPSNRPHLNDGSLEAYSEPPTLPTL